MQGTHHGCRHLLVGQRCEYTGDYPTVRQSLNRLQPAGAGIAVAEAEMQEQAPADSPGNNGRRPRHSARQKRCCASRSLQSRYHSKFTKHTNVIHWGGANFYSDGAITGNSGAIAEINDAIAKDGGARAPSQAVIRAVRELFSGAVL